MCINMTISSLWLRLQLTTYRLFLFLIVLLLYIETWHIGCAWYSKARYIYYLQTPLCMAGFLILRLCVCVSVNKISQKVLNRSTLFLVEVFPLTQKGNRLILKKIAPGKGWVCVCGGGGKIWP